MNRPSSKRKQYWWQHIAELTTIETADPAVNRRGQLLAIFFLLIFVLLFYILLDNAIQFALRPNTEYAVYILEELMIGALFYAFWYRNRKGKVQSTAYISITATILIAALTSAPSYLEYILVIFALPIGISSFIIRPSSSFLFTLLTMLAFSISSFIYNHAWEYNLVALLSLLALAFMTWVTAQQLENTLQKNSELLATLRKSNANIQDAYETTLEGWSHALDMRDKETEGHTQRVTELTLKIARAIGMGGEELVHIRRGALLHDIGKLGVPDYILHKPSQLTEEEMNIMKQHPRNAYGLIYPIQYLRPSTDIPYYHHEKWDGSGYPQGIKGKEIPLPARIFAIVDVYDALTNNRPYRKAWTKKQTLDYIKSESGKHFDPQLVDVFLKEVGKDAN